MTAKEARALMDAGVETKKELERAAALEYKESGDMDKHLEIVYEEVKAACRKIHSHTTVENSSLKGLTTYRRLALERKLTEDGYQVEYVIMDKRARPYTRISW